MNEWHEETKEEINKKIITLITGSWPTLSFIFNLL